MLSAMRRSTKVIMWLVVIAMTSWLVFQVGMNLSGQGGSGGPKDVGSVNGTPIRYQIYLDAYRVAYEQARQQNPGYNFSREEVRDIENQAFNSLVQSVLLQNEYDRRGIVVTDREIVDAVRQLPPPEVTQSPDFQTNGQFDPNKYERFLASSNANTRQYLLTMEARYRDELPRYKLLQEVTSDIYVPDAKLWGIWKDAHDSATVRMMVIRGNEGRSEAAASEDEIKRYYDAHQDEFRRPARAQLSFVMVLKLPTPVDSVQLAAHARALRDSLLHGADFAAVARAESADTASATQGGSLGTFPRGQMDPAFDRAVFSLPIGQVSEPVYTQFGIHLIRVDARTRDSATARHILIPFARIGARRDTLEARADSLDRMVADQSEPAMLDSVARLMSLPVEKGPILYKDTPYIIGRYRIPDVGVWAFEAHRGETSPVIETNGGYYVFRLDSLWQPGTAPLSEVQREAQVAVLKEKRRAHADTTAKEVERMLNSGQTLDQVSHTLGTQLATVSFARTSSVPVLGTATPAVGAAFRLRVGERSPVMHNDEAYFVLQSMHRTMPDSTAWEAQKEQQRAQVIRSARQLRVQLYMDALRRSAKVKDRRAEVMRPAAATATN